MQITINIDDNVIAYLKKKGISLDEAINEFLSKFKKDIEYVSDEEQKEIEEILNSMSKEDKEVAFSKIIEIDI